MFKNQVKNFFKGINVKIISSIAFVRNQYMDKIKDNKNEIIDLVLN